MIRPTPDQLASIASVAKQHVRFVEIIRLWRTLELDRLPQQQQNVALFQGRCQILKELLALLENAPEQAAAQQPTN